MKRLMLLGCLAWAGLAYAQAPSPEDDEGSIGDRPIARSLGEQAVGSRFGGVPGLAPETGNLMSPWSIRSRCRRVRRASALMLTHSNT